MRRFPVALLLCLLLTVTGLTLAGMAVAVSAPAPARHAGSGSTANAALVRRFYDAINDAIRTGDAGELDTILAPDFVAHGIAPNAFVDREAFHDYLAELRATYPALRLSVEEVVAGQDAVVVRLAVEGGDRGAIAGAAIVDSVAPWGTADSLRVRHGQIVEFWGRHGVVPQPRFRVELPALPAGPLTIQLDRLVVGGDGGAPPVDRWPRLLWVEAGVVTLSVAAAGGDDEGRSVVVTRATGGVTDFAETVEMRAATLLSEGDVAVIPAGVAYDLTGPGTAPAVLIGLSMRPSNLVADSDVIVDPRQGDAAALDPSRELTGWPLGATVEPVASWDVTFPASGPVDLATGWLRLEPNATLKLEATQGPLLLVVDAGSLSVAAERVERGETVALAAGTTVALSAMADVPTTCLVFALIPG
jgi:predicted ester cyclase